MADMAQPEFELDGDEGQVLNVGPLEVDPNLGMDEWLIGKVLMPHRVEPRLFISVMRRLWESRNCTEIRHVGTNLFSFKFASSRDRDLVLRSGPWFFNRHLVALNLFDLKVNPTVIPFIRVPFWIQAHGLPYTHRTDTMARSLGGIFDGFIEWDKYAAHRYGVSLRIRAWLNVDKPLRRGQMVAAGSGAPLRVSFKYEKLGNFCFRCGKLDHVILDCGVEDDGSVNRFGLWLKAEDDRRHGGRKYVADQE